MNYLYTETPDAVGYPESVRDYLHHQLDDYISFFPNTVGFEQAIEQRTFASSGRKTLKEVFLKQYEKLPAKSISQQNIELLEHENTYTVCTGHQLGIFTGPLYTIYKVLHTIALSRKLKSQFPDKNFVPVFWLASEDHDLEEIRSVQYFGKTFSWETPQTGAVGRMNTEGITGLLEQIKPLFENSVEAKKYLQLFEQIYTKENLADATQALFHELMGDLGLLILNPDDAALKKVFAEYMVRDIIQEFNHPHLLAQTQKLSEVYKTQVFPREINFFYLEPGSRQRIKAKNEGGNTFTAEEILKFPQDFSPNVCLRPLYQEVILPNIAYIGGPGEISYWLQFKKMFEANEVPFPIILPRYSVFVQSKSFQQKWQALGFKNEDIYTSIDALKNSYLEKNATIENLTEEKNKLANLKQSILNKAAQVDPTLVPSAEAVYVRMNEQLEGFEKKLEKQQKQKFDVDLKKIEKLYTEQFPNQAPQDRSANLLAYAGLIDFDGLVKEMEKEYTGCLIGVE